MENKITAINARTNAVNRDVIKPDEISKIVKKVPLIIPASTPVLLILFHQSVRSSAGPNAAPSPPQA